MELLNTLYNLQIDLGLDDHSHLITAEQRLSFAMARQKIEFLHV